MNDPSNRIQLLSGSYHNDLAEAVARHLHQPLLSSHLAQFANGEISCRLDQSVRGADVFILQSHGRPVNDCIMEQAILIDAAKRASARTITAICPYFGYARQDRKSSGREPITAKLIVDLLTAAGADRLMSIDLHSGQIQGFFNGPFDHLTAAPVLIQYLQDNMPADVVVVSPDAGRVKLAEKYARRLGVDLAIIHKRRSLEQANTVEALAVIGEVKGRCCVLIDDMIDTGGTLCAAARQLKASGATKVYALSTHGVLSDPACKRLQASDIDRVVVTDSLPIADWQRFEKLEVVSIAPLIAGAIEAVFTGQSVSRLFDGENQI